MTTISTNTTITSSSLSLYTWPIAINTNVTLTLKGNLNILENSWYFLINGNNINIVGNKCVVSITAVNYLGLVQNNPESNYVNISISNIILKSQLNLQQASQAGWICQKAFQNGIVKYCSINADISSNSGGIFGYMSSNCKAINCITNGNIGQYAGGIFGAYTVNCNALNCYSNGLIGQYAGGIFGFGTNYMYDNISMNPSNIISQDGNIINFPTTNNNYVSQISLSSAVNCYSNGTIGQYAGGIYGYFAYKSTARNCYSLGYNGGIFTYNSYEDGAVYTPTNALCKAKNCYTCGNSIMATDGQVIDCYSEKNNRWNSHNALKTFKNVEVWTQIDNYPFLLSSFNSPIYLPYPFSSSYHHKRDTKSILGKFKTGQYLLGKTLGNNPDVHIDINLLNGQLHIKNIKNKKTTQKTYY